MLAVLKLKKKEGKEEKDTVELQGMGLQADNIAGK